MVQRDDLRCPGGRSPSCMVAWANNDEKYGCRCSIEIRFTHESLSIARQRTACPCMESAVDALPALRDVNAGAAVARPPSRRCVAFLDGELGTCALSRCRCAPSVPPTS